MEDRLELVVYKEISKADIRKLSATSADAATGGGARDLRFPWGAFENAMSRIFTISKEGGGERPVRIARVSYVRDDELRKSDLEYWPPTNSRRWEGRIARIHESPELGKRPPRSDRGRVFVLLQRHADGVVWCSYAYEDELRTTGVWPDVVRLPILRCIDATAVLAAPNKAAIQGIIDLADNSHYCHPLGPATGAKEAADDAG